MDDLNLKLKPRGSSSASQSKSGILRWPDLNDQRWLGLALTIPTLVAIFGVVLLPFISSLTLQEQSLYNTRTFFCVVGRKLFPFAKKRLILW